MEGAEAATKAADVDDLSMPVSSLSDNKAEDKAGSQEHDVAEPGTGTRRVTASDLSLGEDASPLASAGLMHYHDQHQQGQPGQQNQQQQRAPILQDSLAAMKLGGARLAGMVRNVAGPLRNQNAAGASVPLDEPSTAPATDNNTMARVRATAGAFGARAKDAFLDASMKTATATAEGLRRLTLGEPLQALCRQETARHPVPQLVLACCTALTAGGLSTQRLFRHDPPQELVERLLATAGAQAVLLPPGTSPHAVAALLKQFLLGLPEPLLTYRLLPDWVAAADKPETSRHLLKQLPTANANTLRLLLQLCHYINDNSAVNEMDSLALAEALAPCLGWMQAPAQPQQQGSSQSQGLLKSLSLSFGSKASEAPAAGPAALKEGPLPAIAEGPAGTEGEGSGSGAAGWVQGDHRIVPLEDVELEGLVIVLEYLISNFVLVFG